MRLKKSLLFSSLLLSLPISAANAQTFYTNEGQSRSYISSTEESQNIINFYEREIQRRNSIEELQLLKEETEIREEQAAISTELATFLLTKVDSKIKELSVYEELPLDKKREKLINQFKTALKDHVASGHLFLTEEEQKDIIAKYAQNLEKWDGRGNLHE